ncbi:Uncharacterised protein [uncultured archaeon]|nr:Uncharacterised protein [uncultured archaeon]
MQKKKLFSITLILGLMFAMFVVPASAQCLGGFGGFGCGNGFAYSNNGIALDAAGGFTTFNQAIALDDFGGFASQNSVLALDACGNFATRNTAIALNGFGSPFGLGWFGNNWI